MSLKPRQDTRIGSLETPLGKDRLVVARFEGIEGLSQLFEFRIDAFAQQPVASFDSAIGDNCCLSIKNFEGQLRHFNGALVNVQALGKGQTYYAYRLILRPWLWFLTRTSNCFIFRNMNVPDIIMAVFKRHGFNSYTSRRLGGGYPELKYCVQYRETDHDFVCRLMEQAGIYYYFVHSAGEHKLVLADSKSSHDDKPGGAELTFQASPPSQYRDMEYLYVWQAGRQFNTGKVVLKDYDFWQPGAELISQKEASSSYRNAKLEVFDYPGKYKDKSLGDTYARVKLEAEQASDRRCQAEGDAVSVFPGCLIDLKDHPDKAQNRRHLAVSATHYYESDAYTTSSSSRRKNVYRGQYEFLPSDIPFRAPQITPKPVISGPQTARVVGDGEIDVDKHGCILVQFHWDRYNQWDRDRKNYRRVRVAQVWSGKAWGGIYIPRVGQEVVVEFIEGDPDRPLVTGTVYNGNNTPPYKLPSKKTVAGVKSQSTEGKPSGFNEFVFDDLKGSELVRLHAEKNLESVINNDEARKIGNNISVEVGKVMTVEAGKKIELKVCMSKIIIEPNGITIQAPTITIKADATIDATSPLTTVKGTALLTLKGGLVLIN